MQQGNMTAAQFREWLTGEKEPEPFTGLLAHSIHVALQYPRGAYAMLCAEATHGRMMPATAGAR